MNKKDLKTISQMFCTKTLREYSANVKINRYIDRIEIVQYKENFDVYYGERDDNNKVDRSRFFTVGADGVLIPARDDIDISNLQDSVDKSVKRSCEMFYRYAYANNWKYFVTLTANPELVDRNNDEAVKRLWGKFGHYLRHNCNFDDFKFLCVPERHKPNPEYPKGALHFHALFGDVDFSDYIEPYIKNGKQVRSKSGSLLFKFPLWQFGFATLCVIPQAPDDQAGTIRYLAKYMKKESTNLGYNKKRYFASRNLACASKLLYDFDDHEQQQLAKFCDMIAGDLVKVTDNAKYYEIRFDELKKLGLNENDILDATTYEKLITARKVFDFDEDDDNDAN